MNDNIEKENIIVCDFKNKIPSLPATNRKRPFLKQKGSFTNLAFDLIEASMIEKMKEDIDREMRV